MGKAIENKQAKFESMMESAFELFTDKGIGRTSVSDITSKSGVAKGTFYLYFKDKYDIRNKLVLYESSKLFRNAYEKLDLEKYPALSDKIIFIIDDILDQLKDKPKKVALISKNLSWAVLKKEIERPSLTEIFDLSVPFHNLTNDAGIKLHESEIMLYMIIELVGATSYSAILYDEPCSIEELKPYIYKSIKNIVKDFSGAE